MLSPILSHLCSVHTLPSDHFHEISGSYGVECEYSCLLLIGPCIVVEIYRRFGGTLGSYRDDGDSKHEYSYNP
jgi:hypothetical protein